MQLLINKLVLYRILNSFLILTFSGLQHILTLAYLEIVLFLKHCLQNKLLTLLTIK